MYLSRLVFLSPHQRSSSGSSSFSPSSLSFSSSSFSSSSSSSSLFDVLLFVCFFFVLVDVVSTGTFVVHDLDFDLDCACVGFDDPATVGVFVCDDQSPPQGHRCCSSSSSSRRSFCAWSSPRFTFFGSPEPAARGTLSLALAQTGPRAVSQDSAYTTQKKLTVRLKLITIR